MPDIVDTWDGEQNTTVWAHDDGNWTPNVAECVTTEGDQTITGQKTFSVPIVGDIITTATGGTAPRSLADRSADAVNVKDYGAKGNGTADDTSAIQSAIDYATGQGKTVFFPDGEYACSVLTLSTSVTMSGKAVLKYNGSGSNDPFVSVSGSGIIFGDIYIDCNDQEIKRGLYVPTDGNYFRSVHVKNMTSDVRLVTAILVTGSGNTFDSIAFNDLVNTGYPNDSTPQGLVLSDPTDGVCNGNVFHDVSSTNARSTVVNNSTGINQFGDVYSYECKDNGFYAVNAGLSLIGNIYYDGDDNGVGFRHGANARIGNVYVTNAGSYGIFIGNCGDVTIDHYYVDMPVDGTAPPLGLNETMPTAAGEKQGAGRITIGAITGKAGYVRPIFLPASINGSSEYIESLTIGRIDLRCKYAKAVDANRGSWLVLSAARELHIGEVVLTVEVTDAETGTDTNLYVGVNTSLERASDFYGISPSFVLADGSQATAAYGIFCNADNYAQEKLTVHTGTLTNNSTLFYNGSLLPDGLQAGAPPSAGYWRKGQSLNAANPSSSAVGYVCSAAGTPGTWITITA